MPERVCPKADCICGGAGIVSTLPENVPMVCDGIKAALPARSARERERAGEVVEGLMSAGWRGIGVRAFTVGEVGHAFVALGPDNSDGDEFGISVWSDAGARRLAFWVLKADVLKLALALLEEAGEHGRAVFRDWTGREVPEGQHDIVSTPDRSDAAVVQREWRVVGPLGAVSQSYDDEGAARAHCGSWPGSRIDSRRVLGEWEPLDA